MLDHSLRILVVDDIVEMRSIIMEVCKNMGFTDVSEAGNGVEAWQILKNANPQFGLIISDYNMPHHSGLDLLHKVRADHGMHLTQFLMMSAQDDKLVAKEIVNSGANYYLVKPFHTQQLEEAIRSLLTKSEKNKFE